MAVIPLEAFVQDPRLFDLAHGIVERQQPILGLAHSMFDTTLTRVELSLRARVAVGLGIRTFEVISGPDFATDIRAVDVIRFGTQTEKTGNFLLQFIEELNQAGARLPDTAPELAEASERLVLAHLDDPEPELVFCALSGAGMMHEVFSETYLSTILGDE